MNTKTILILSAILFASVEFGRAAPLSLTGKSLSRERRQTNLGDNGVNNGFGGQGNLVIGGANYGSGTGEGHYGNYGAGLGPGNFGGIGSGGTNIGANGVNNGYGGFGNTFLGANNHGR